MYKYGEIGYEPEGESRDLNEAIEFATSMSVDSPDSHVGIWNGQGDLLYVTVEGDLFKLVEA